MKLEDLKTAIKASPDLFQTEINVLIDIALDPNNSGYDKALRAKTNKLIGKKDAYYEIGSKLDSLEKLYSREEVIRLLDEVIFESDDPRELLDANVWLDKKEAKNG